MRRSSAMLGSTSTSDTIVPNAMKKPDGFVKYHRNNPPRSAGGKSVRDGGAYPTGSRMLRNARNGWMPVSQLVCAVASYRPVSGLSTLGWKASRP